jgi:hypothetical protein
MRNTPRRNPITAALLALALAALACNLPFAGGEVSPTPAPVEEPTDLPPTEAPPPTEVPPTAASQEPPPVEATLPDQPPDFADFPAVIADYLSAGGSVEGLESTLRAWGSIVDRWDSVFADADLTGDTVPDVIVVAYAPEAQVPDPILWPTSLMVFGSEDGAYRLLHIVQSGDAPHFHLTIVSVADINASGTANLVYTSSTCGAHTCFVGVSALAYDPASGEMLDLLSGEVGGPYSSASIVDVDGDGVSEILVDVGGIGSVGAGPQRTYRETYVWDGERYVLSETVVTSELWPIHYVQDGDAAAEAGDYAAALDIYQEFLDQDDPLMWTKDPDEIPGLRRYARYRVMLTHVLLGDDASAEAVYESLRGEVTLVLPVPEAGFVALADVFWESYAQTRDVGQACRAVVEYAGSHPTTFELLNLFGYANRQYAAEDMCPFGG